MAKYNTKQVVIKEHFLIREAAKLTGLTPAMVDYLCRSGVLVPSGRCTPGRGRSRHYLFGDVVMLKVLAKLLKCGISVARMKKALQQLRKNHVTKITESTLPGKYLVTNGSRVFFKSKEEVIEDLTAGGQLAFGFVIELEELRDAVKTEMITQGYAVLKPHS